MAADYPDGYRASVLPSISALSTARRFYYSTAGSVEAETIAEVDVLTVEEGLQLQVSFLSVSCSASCIQEIKLREVHDSTAYAFFYSEYDTHGSWSLPDDHVYPIEAGNKLQLHIYNNDTSERNFIIVLYGKYNEV